MPVDNSRESESFQPRSVPVGLTTRKVHLIAEALELFYTTCDEDESEEVDELHQFFDNLYLTLCELEPIR